ncbi:MAG: ComEC/Rec2 family competence protein [Clostridia bacterium]|nr:ComEC/Rec2 family competence protein [Clostridia bacterium]
MDKFKYLPMASIGFSALLIMLVIIISGYNFEGGAVALAIGVVLLTVTVISKKLREVTVLFYLSASLLFSGILMMSNADCSIDAANSVTGKDVEVVARVTGDSESYPSKTVYILETKSVGGTEINVKLRLISNTSIAVYAGDEISFNTDVYSADRFDADLKRHYMSEGIYLGANIFEGDEDITLLKDGSDTFTCKIQRVRDEIKSRIYSVLPNEYGAVSVAMLLGDKSAVSDETLAAFRGAGVYHLFAVSGLHLSIWVLGIFNFLKKLGVSKRFNSLLAVLVTCLFMALTGFTPSVTRAGIMLIVLMVGNLFRRTSHSLNSLGFSLFIILAVNPMAAASVSLLLSFSATLGIVTLYQSIDKALNFRLSAIKKKPLRKTIKALLSIFFVSVSASIFTFPISCVAFGEICVIGPVTNVLISYAATLMMIAAGGIALLFSIPFGVNLCGLVCGILAKYIIYISKLFSGIPYACIKTDDLIFAVFAAFALCAVICCFILFKEHKIKIKAIIASVLCVSVLCFSAHLIYNRNLTTVQVMDVDDGICLIVKNKGETAVIGCGASDTYCSDDISYEIYKKASLLIVPDNKDWNCALLPDLSSAVSFDRIISGEAISDFDTIVEPDFKLNPWDNSSIEFHKTKSITYAYCVFGSSDMLIIFDCTENANLSKHLDADVLVCSYYLPDNMDISGFDSIIISSTKAVGEDMINRYSSQNSNIYSTLGETDFTLNFRLNKEVSISYN